MAVEFSRDITFGQYLNLRSIIHTLDPRIKILATGVLMLSVFLTRSLAGYAVLLIGAALLLRISHVPLGYVLRGLRLLVITLSIFFLFQLLFYPLPAGSQPLWRWGILSISAEGALEGVRLLLRVVLLYYLTTMLMFTTPMMDLADGIEIMLDPLKRLRVPVNELVMVMVIALKFVPLLVAELERLIKAQTARGVRFDQGGLIQRARRLGPLLIPLFVNAFNRADILTTAMNARCYRGGQGRTKRRVLTFRRADVVGLGAALLLAAATVVIGRMISI